jgi:hypothetical protein
MPAKSSSSPIVRSPFADAVGKSKVTAKGTSGGVYDREPNLPSGIPAHDLSPNGVPELLRDKAMTSKSPVTSGVLRTPFKDAAK